jgi:hypothetical protein
MDVLYQYERDRTDQRGSGSGRSKVRKVSCPLVLLASQILNLDLRHQNALHSPKAAGRVKPGRPGKRGAERKEVEKQVGSKITRWIAHNPDPPGTRPDPRCDFCQASQSGPIIAAGCLDDEQGERAGWAKV